MKYVLLAAAVFACAFSPVAARAQSLEQQLQLCGNDNEGGTPPAQGIAACTALLNSGQMVPANIPLAYAKRGRFYLFSEDYGRAIADFNQAIKLNPQDRASYFNRGRSEYLSGDNNGAVADITEAIRLGLKGADVYGTRGQAYAKKGDYSSAIVDFSDAIRINPQDSFSYIDRGDAYKELKDYAHAIADYDTAIKLDPQTAIFYFLRGRIKLEQADQAGAFADFSAAVKIEPNEALYQYARGLAAQKLGRAAEGQADIAKAKALNPDVEKTFASGNAASSPSKTSGAPPAADSTTASASQEELSALGAGELFAKADELDQQGKADEARIVRRTLIERFPDSPLAAQAAKQLSSGGGIGSFSMTTIALAAAGMALLALVGFGASRLFRRKAKSAPVEAAAAMVAADENPKAKPKGKLVPLLVLGGVAAAALAAFVLWPRAQGPGGAAPTETASAAGDPEMCSPVPIPSVSIDQRIAACTDIIKAGQVQGAELAQIYQARGLFYVSPLNRTIDRDRAVADFGEAIKLDPQSAGAYLNRAGSLAILKDYDRAIADTNTGIKLTDTTQEGGFFPYATLGKVYFLKGDYAQANAAFEQVSKIADGLDVSKALGQANGLYGRGIIALKTGRTAAGQADIAKAEALFSNVENFFIAYGMTPSDIASAAPASTATSAAASAAGKPGSLGQVESRFLDQSLSPDFKAYFAGGDLDAYPYLQVNRPSQPALWLRIGHLSCTKMDSTKNDPDCKSGSGFNEYWVSVGTLAKDDSQLFDCPDIRHPENGCAALWREKGAEIIAMARGLRR